MPPFRKSLATMDFVDIHTHLLPGVDDGSGDMDETVAMLRRAYDGGTRKMVATPHMFLDLFGNNDLTAIQDRFELLAEELVSLRDRLTFLQEMQVYLGAENYASPEFLEALDQGCVLTLNGSRYLLLETAPVMPIRQARQVIERVFAAGYTPVLAHPERWISLRDDPMKLEDLWSMGCAVQVNAGSLLGESGSRAKKCAWKLLNQGLVDVIATDGHRLEWRPPAMEGLFEKLMGDYREEDVAFWLVKTPSMILANESLETGNRE